MTTDTPTLSKQTNAKCANGHRDQLSSPVSCFKKLLTEDYQKLRTLQKCRGGFSNNSCLTVGKPWHFSDPPLIVDVIAAIILPLYALSLAFSLFGTSIVPFQIPIVFGTNKPWFGSGLWCASSSNWSHKKIVCFSFKMSEMLSRTKEPTAVGRWFTCWRISFSH